MTISPADRRRYYAALVQRDSDYEGTFYVGIVTTGIFCRPGCSARKPKFENCEFFRSLDEALRAGYRPCRRCRPLSPPGEASTAIRTLIEAIDSNPDRRWSEQDLRQLGLDASTVRRHFKSRFGMTFAAYARTRRLGLAVQQLRAGRRVIDVQLDTGFESGSGFRDAFCRLLGAPPKDYTGTLLYADWIDTPLGTMVALASEHALNLLEFADRRGLEREILCLRRRTQAAIVPAPHPLLESIRTELTRYFAGESLEFSTPVAWRGTAFQQQVWEQLLTIPAGTTRSYAQQAAAIGMPAAVRAVARANGANQLAIIVPCHRVVGSDGSLTGYAGGLARKRWLLDHERIVLSARRAAPSQSASEAG
ncbi:MAG: bifunctional transcriptional activator/DNA repair enzyme AdaA [Pirellulaceae bacterium]